jgi:methylase of polypeptide subunit release factors
MSVEVVDRETVETLRALRDAVRVHQYDTVCQVHCYELAPRWLDASLRETLARAPEPTQALLRLLWFEEAVERRRVERLLGGPLVDGLRRIGVLADGTVPDTVVSRYRLEVLSDTLLLVMNRALGPTGVYFGEDSQFLRSQLWPRRGDVCLDLCTGSGVQGLRCAPLAERVDLVDRHPGAARLAAMNGALNELSERIVAYHGDLWGPLPEQAVYDHVTCNPPLVPVPESVKFPLFGHGGADGLDIVRRIVTALPQRLSARGRCTLIGACTGDARTPVIVPEVEQHLAGTMDVVVFLLLRLPLRDWVKIVTDTVTALYPGASAGQTIAAARASYGAAFERTCVYTYLLKVERGGASAGCRVFDYSTVGQKSYWFVNRGKVAR